MPNIPGSKWDKKLRKYVPPEGAETSKLKATKRIKDTRENEKLRAADPGPFDKTAAFNTVRRHEKVAQGYGVFALYPGRARAWIGWIDTPTHEALAHKWGGGSYQVVPWDAATQAYVGEPADLNVDTLTYPPKLAGFKDQAPAVTAAAPASGFPPLGGPLLDTSATAKQLEEAAEEIEDLEDELSQVKGQLAAAVRERDEAKADLQRERMERIQAEERSRFDRAIADLKAEIAGNKKDPLQTFLEFRKMDADLQGPLSRPADPFQQIETMLAVMKKLKDAMPEADGGDGGGSGMMLEKILSVADKLMPATQAQPVALPAAPTAATPSGPRPIEIAAREMYAYLESAFSQGQAPAAVAAWIKQQEGQGFADVRQALLNDTPEAFAEVGTRLAPKLVETDQGKTWIVEVVKAFKATAGTDAND